MRSHRISQRKRRRSNRRGATTVEMAIILMTFLVLVFGMLDLALGVLRYNTLAQAARQVAREAIVHGSLADRLGPWGSGSYSGSAADSHPIAQFIQEYSSLNVFDLSEVTVQVEWPDGANEFQQRVHVTVSMPYRPIITFIFGNPVFTLEATSEMPIAH